MFGWLPNSFRKTISLQEKVFSRSSKVEISPECSLSVCSVAKGIKNFLHGNNRGRFAVSCFPDNTVGALLITACYINIFFKIFPIKPKGYNNDLSQSPCLGIITIIVIIKHQNNHLAESPSNLVLFANVAVNVR